MSHHSSRAPIAWTLLVLTLLIAVGPALAAGLNTNVALTPPEGGTIVRMQWRHSELGGDKTARHRTGVLNIEPITIVHGFTSKLELLATVPIVQRDVHLGINDRHINDSGVGDIPLLAKYRFYQNDQRGSTTRWAAIGGVQLPSYSAFSDDSVDPILGTVWTHQEANGWWLDADALYQINTGGGINKYDQLRGDAAFSYSLLSGQSKGLGPWGLYGVAELNAHYFTDGSTQAFASPGVQFITPRWILEAGVQLPIEQDLKAPRLETKFTTVLSVRFQF